MDSTVLRALLLSAALLATAGCSLVVDTDECVTDADCDFGDGAVLQCVSSECVPARNVSRSALVPASVERDTSWTARTLWVLEGVVIVQSGVTLTIEPDAMVSASPDAAILVEPGAKLVLTDPRAEIERLVFEDVE